MAPGTNRTTTAGTSPNVGSGMPTTAGSIPLEHSMPPDNSTVAANLRTAGAVILGKTNLSEFANFITNSNPSGYSGVGDNQKAIQYARKALPEAPDEVNRKNIQGLIEQWEKAGKPAGTQ